MLHSQQAFTLLEVLIAWFVITSLLFGISFLQIEQVHWLRHAYYYSLAVIRLESLAERLHANQAVSQYQKELADWNEKNKEIFPQGTGNCHCVPHKCQVTIEWNDGEKRSLSLTVGI